MKPDLRPLIEAFLAEDPDAWRRGKLHPSSDLSGCQRKTALELAGAKRKKRTLGERSAMRVGAALHKDFQEFCRSRGMVCNEVDLSSGLGDGWAGKPDLLFWLRAEQCWALWDVKTISGNEMHWARIYNDLPKEEHRWQVSAYVHAARKLGIPVKYAGIIYWPKDAHFKDMRGHRYPLEPLLIDVDVFPEDVVAQRMEMVKDALDPYVAELKASGDIHNPQLPDFVAPQQKLVPKPSKKNVSYYELWQETNWRCGYCPFRGESCHPPEVKTKLGEYHPGAEGWTYEPDPRHQHVAAEVKPS